MPIEYREGIWETGWFVFLDICGFKNLTKALGKGLEKKYRVAMFRASMLLDANSILTNLDRDLSTDLTRNTLIYSDSIAVFVPVSWFQGDDALHSAFLMAGKTGSAIATACMVEDLPCRGALSFGECLFDKSTGILIGEPIVRAAEWEKNQQWLWFSVEPESVKHIEPDWIEDSESGYRWWQVPIKDSTEGKRLPVLEPYRSELREEVPASFRRAHQFFDDDDVKSKWENTASYFQHFFREPLIEIVGSATKPRKQ